MARSTITAKGQVTVPKEIRERLGLTQGDVVDFRVDERGRLTVVVLEEQDLGVLRDFAPSKAMTPQEMKRAIRRRAKAKAMP